jgi:hypothetical protein
MPFVSANVIVIDPPTVITFGDELLETLLKMNELEWRQVTKLADIQAGIGAAEKAIKSGQYTGPALQRIQELRNVLKSKEAAMTGGGAAAVAASPFATQALIGAAQVGGFLAVLTNWGDVFGTAGHDMTEEEHRQWMEANIAPIDNTFYHVAGNYFWLTELYMDLFNDGYYTYENRAEKKAHYWELTQRGWNDIGEWFSGLFGSDPGPQVLPAVGMVQLLKMMECEEVGTYGPGIGMLANSTIYKVPMNTYVPGEMGTYAKKQQNAEGRTVIEMMGGWWHSNGQYIYYVPRIFTSSGSRNYDLIIIVYNTMRSGDPTRKPYDVMIMQVTCGGSGQINYMSPMFSEYITTTQEAFALAEMPYINSINALQEQINNLENKLDNLVIQFPHIENATGDPYIDFYEWTKLLPQWNPVATVVTDPDTGTGTQTCQKCAKSPCECGTKTDEDDDKDKDNSHFHLFPFCIPFDVVDMIKGLSSTPEAPRWEIPFALPGFLAEFMGQETEIIVVDLSFLEQIMPLVRLLILAVFIMMLARATSGFIKW